MIVIFSPKGYGISHTYFMLKYFDKNCIVLSDYNEKYFKEATVIIPNGIQAQKRLGNYLQYKNKFLVNHDYIYDKLDDKINFYNMIRQHDILKNSYIRLINTYDSKYKGPNKYSKFIIKHRKGAGSNDNKIVTDNIYNLIKKYGDDYQIQDILDVKKIHGINYLCKKGKLISGLDFIYSGFIDNDNNYSDVKQELKNVEQKYVDVISKIVEKVNYNGFIELEFLEDTNDNIYLMEINPRISGNIKCTVQQDEYTYAPYITNLLAPYCDIITKKIDDTNLSNKLELINYSDGIEIIYQGNLHVPKHKPCNCGVVRFLEQVLIPHDEYYVDKVMALDEGNFVLNKLNDINNVIQTCNKKNIKVIFSYACEHNEFLLNNYDILKANNINFCIPSRNIFETFDDKTKFYKYMINNDFSEYIPKVYNLKGYNEIIMPCILKHNKSWYGRQTYIIKTERDIPRDINLDEYAICEIIEGKIEYATHILANNGEIIKELTIQHSFDRPVFVHGVTKKPTTSHEIKINSNVLNIFKDIVKKSQYSGIICVDYKIVNNCPKIFEINPRVGGSLTRSNGFGSFIDKFIELCS